MYVTKIVSHLQLDLSFFPEVMIPNNHILNFKAFQGFKIINQKSDRSLNLVQELNVPYTCLPYYTRIYIKNLETWLVTEHPMLNLVDPFNPPSPPQPQQPKPQSQPQKQEEPESNVYMEPRLASASAILQFETYLQANLGFQEEVSGMLA